MMDPVPFSLDHIGARKCYRKRKIEAELNNTLIQQVELTENKDKSNHGDGPIFKTLCS